MWGSFLYYSNQRKTDYATSSTSCTFPASEYYNVVRYSCPQITRIRYMQVYHWLTSLITNSRDIIFPPRFDLGLRKTYWLRDYSNRVQRYLSGIDGIVHDWNPSFKSSHLKKTKIRLPNVIKIHWGVLPRIIFSFASYLIRYNFVIQFVTILILALQNSKTWVYCTGDIIRGMGFHGYITLWYFPANNCTPIMANISQKMRQTSNTLKILGTAWTRALTTI